MSIHISRECADFLEELRAAARERGHEYLLPEHLLFLLCGYPAVEEMLRTLGANTGQLRRELERFFEERVEKTDAEEISFSLSLLRILNGAEQQVVSSGRTSLEVTDLMVALFSEEQSYAVYLLHEQDIFYEGVIDYLTDMTHPEWKEEADENAGPDSEPAANSALELYALDLNRMAREGKMDAIVGREKER